MMKTLIPLFLIFSFYACSTTELNSGQIPLNNGVSFYKSQFLNENIPYKIFLPENLDQKKSNVNLLVLLDGSEYSGIANNSISLYEFGGKLNPTIILSLPSTSQSRWSHYTPSKAEADNDGNKRDHYQYTGNYNKFANFVKTELIPFIEDKYQVKFKSKSIFGHSMGGLAVLSFLVFHPEIFDNYISASPSTMYDDHYLFKTIESKDSIMYQSLLLTAALNDQNGYRENVIWLHNFLKKSKNEDQNLEMKIYDSENHATSGIRSIIDGIDFVSKN